MPGPSQSRWLFALRTAASIVIASPLVLAQNDPARAPTFDVATIKPHSGRAMTRGLIYQPDGFTGTVTVFDLVQYSYTVLNGNQLTGAPDWAKNDLFDIQVKIGEEDLAKLQNLSPAESSPQRAQMMRSLLAERFKLKVHSETKQIPVYELVIVKGGSKLKDAATDTDPTVKKGENGKPLTGLFMQRQSTSIAQGYSMASLADFLSAPYAGVGRPVVNKTGLPSTYDFTLNWSVYTAQVIVRDGAAVGSVAGDDAPSIFGALQEVGLKLQPATGPIENVVIDHVEKPSAD